MNNFIEQLFALFDINVKQKKTICYPETIYLEKNIEKYLKIREKIITEINKLYTSGFISKHFYPYRSSATLHSTATTIVINFELFKFASKPYDFDKKYYLKINYYPTYLESDIVNNALFLSDLDYSSDIQNSKIIIHQSLRKSYIDDKEFTWEHYKNHKKKMAFIDKVFFILKEYKHYVTEDDLEEALLHILDNVSKVIESTINPAIVPASKDVEIKIPNPKSSKGSTLKRSSRKK